MSEDKDKFERRPRNRRPLQESIDEENPLNKSNMQYGTSSMWKDFTTKEPEDSKYDSFEAKSLINQARIMTLSLLTKDENPLFEFDYKDNEVRREVMKSMITAGIYFSFPLITLIFEYKQR